jgi:hypothetical protein
VNEAFQEGMYKVVAYIEEHSYPNSEEPETFTLFTSNWKAFLKENKVGG